MIIKRLALTGFRSFVRAELQFAAGQNYVFGHNWQGKSSIVDAVGFALFGVDIFPKKIAGTAVKADHLINERSDRGGVELTFDLDGTEYCLKRQLPGRDVAFAKSGETIASGVRTVTEKLVALLGIDVKLFQNIFFSDQDELRKSLEFSPEERRIFTERLLGVEEWKERLDSLRETRRRLEGFLADLTSGRLGVFLSHVEELEESIEIRKDEVRDLDASLKKRAGRSPKTVRTLRREERKLEGAVATLQHKELEVRTQLARDQVSSRRYQSRSMPRVHAGRPREAPAVEAGGHGPLHPRDGEEPCTNREGSSQAGSRSGQCGLRRIARPAVRAGRRQGAASGSFGAAGAGRGAVE